MGWVLVGLEMGWVLVGLALLLLPLLPQRGCRAWALAQFPSFSGSAPPGLRPPPAYRPDSVAQDHCWAAGGAGFFFGSVCTNVIHGGSFLGAAILSDSLGVPLGLGTGGSCSLPFTRPLLTLCSTVPSCCRLDRGLGVGGVKAELSEAFLGAGVGRPPGGLASSWGLLGRGGLVGVWNCTSELAWSLSASATAATLRLGSLSSASLASAAAGCCLCCERSLVPDRLPGPSLVQRSAHTKVPSSGPLL